MDYKEKIIKLLTSRELTSEQKQQLETIFPELKESEDERMLREIRRYIKEQGDKPTGLPNGTAAVNDMLSWLEKQGEQKPFNYENANIQQKDFAPKVAPKFKVGDWLINKHRFIIQIIAVEKGLYKYRYNDRILECSWEQAEQNCHLWTIQDAKDGDVLASNSSVFIFQKEYIAGKPTSYCGIVEGDLYQGSGGCWTNEQCYPATKEQRDLLFQKMKESGYEWDSKKKELKKIEQKPSWSEEDEERITNILSVLSVQVCWDGATGKKGNPYQKEINWLKSLKDRIK